MFELLTLFLTGGGSAAMGSILKGVFGAVTDARSQKHEMEMARECRNNENAIQFQQALSNVPGGAFTRATRRMLALIGMCTLSFITCVTTIYPSVPLISTTNITGEGKKEFLFGLLSFPAEPVPSGRYNRTYCTFRGNSSAAINHRILLYTRRA